MRLATEIHVFGGQGSASLFQDAARSIAQSDARASKYTQKLLKECHQGFLLDVAALCADNVNGATQLLAHFATPESLLSPPESYHCDPLVQSTTLCLFQLLRYLARLRTRENFAEAYARLRETAGFCSGILPAHVVSYSPNIDQFILNSVAAFRAAFWIGFRAGAYSTSLLEAQSDGRAPWSYVIVGLSRAQVSDKVSTFNTENPTTRLRVTAVLRDSHITVSGPSPALARFLPQLPSLCSARPVHIHCLYHGGRELEHIAKTVLEDFEQHGISFSILPDAPHRKVRGYSDPEGGAKTWLSLSKCIVETILLRPLDWPQLLQSIVHGAGDHSTRAYVYGPSSSLMVSGLRGYGHDRSLEAFDVSHSDPDVLLASNYDPSETDVAIIGIGLDFPNGSDLDTFWKTLEDGLNFVKPIPDDRIPEQELKQGEKGIPAHGNYLPNPWAFDNSLFNVSPREAKSMDPQQRVVLQTAYHALEDAGYVADATKCFKRETFGCYVGVATGDYVDRLTDEIDVYYSPGTLRAFLSGRISYFFGLSGPSLVVDTACSGSLVSVNLACKALAAGECNAALAGGVNVICSPDMQRGLARAHFLSPNTQCRPFEASANGYCRAEGCGMFVLKRLSDALSENDRILGIIKGTGVNQSGNASSITHPHSEEQEQLFKSVLDQYNIIPRSVGVVEAHGTGTQAGDPIEFTSLMSVFGPDHDSSNPLYVSSVKGNIGHAEAASGAAGLTKLLAMLSKGMVPPQVGLETLNPKISALMPKGVNIPRQPTTWSRVKELPRRALLNNFGAAGSNSCLLLEEFRPQLTEAEPYPARSSYIFTLSAKNEDAIARLRKSMVDSTNLKQAAIQDLSYTSMARRRLLESRLVLSVKSTDKLLEALKDEKNQPAPRQKVKTDAPVIFLCSGQGSFYSGMGRELFKTSPLFKEVMLECDELICSAGGESILPIIQAANPDQECDLTSTHCAIFATEYALARLWVSWNIRPEAVLGHSLGEYVAFVIADVMTLKDAISTIVRRAHLITEKCKIGESAMLAVNAGAPTVRNLLSKGNNDFGDACVACENSPNDCVVYAPTSHLQSLTSAFEKEKTKFKKLNMPLGFHSPALLCIGPALDEFTSRIELREPTLPIGTNLHGKMYTPGDIDHKYFSTQAASTVRFTEAFESLKSQKDLKDAIFIDLGAHPTLLPAVRGSLSGSPATMIGSLHRSKECWEALNEALVMLARRGAAVDWREVANGTNPRMVDLPLYQFSQLEFQVSLERKEEKKSAKGKSNTDKPSSEESKYSLVSSGSGSKQSDSAVYEVRGGLQPFISGHRVADLPLCPASIYVELALQSADDANQLSSSFSVRDVEFSAPLVSYEDQPEKPVKISITSKMHGIDTRVAFQVSAAQSEQTKSSLYCQGYFSSRDETIASKAGALRARTKAKQTEDSIDESRSSTVIRRRMLYESIFTRVVSYSPRYQTIDWLELSEDGLQAHGSFRLRQSALMSKSISQPVFVDTLLHAAGFLANCAVSTSDVCICVLIDRIDIFGNEIDYSEPFKIYVDVVEAKSGFVCECAAYDHQGNLVGYISGITFRKLSNDRFRRSLSQVTSAPKQAETKASSEPAAETKKSEKPAKSQKPKSSPPATQDNARAKLIQAFKDVTAVADVGELDRSTFSDLGIDSLMIIELLEKLKAQFPQAGNISESEFASCTTFSEVQTLLKIDGNATGDNDNGANDDDDGEDGNDSGEGGETSDMSDAITRAPSVDSHGSSASDTPDEVDQSKLRDFVQDAIAKIADIEMENLSADTPLEKLDLDPTKAAKLQDVLKKEHGVDVPAHRFNSRSKAGRDEVEIVRDSAATISLIQKGSDTEPPLYLIHDGSGLTSMYSRIDKINHNVFGVSADRSHPFKSLDHMAKTYASMVDTSKGIILGGWSFGGVVAYEMADYLHSQGHKVHGVVMIDSPCPTNHPGLPDRVIENVCKGKPGWLLKSFQTHSTLLGKHSPSQRKARIPVTLLKSTDVVSSEIVSGDECSFLADPSERSKQIKLWEELVGQLTVLDLPGNHFEPFEDKLARETTSALLKALQAIRGL